MFIFLLILIFIRPFISSLAFPYLNFIYSYLLMLAAFLAFWSIVKNIDSIKIKKISYPFISLCLAITISFIFSTNKLNSLQELYKYVTALTLFLITISLNYEEKNKLLQTLVLAGFIISLLAIYQYFIGFKHTLGYLTQNNPSSPFIIDFIQRKRVFFPFVTPNVLAGYLAMIIALTFINKRRSWMILFFIFAFFLTQSLGAFLSILITLILYYCFQGKLRKSGILLLSGILMLIVVVFLARSVGQKQHAQPIFSTIMRLNYWQDTLKIIREHPFIGIGLGNFNLKMSRYAHNSYLQIWAEIGIFGLISFLWLVISILKSTFRALEVSTDYKKQTIALVFASCVFLIHNFMDFTFFLPEISLLWWIILGATFL